MKKVRTFECADCGNSWQEPLGTSWPGECPACHGGNVHRLDAGGGRENRGLPADIGRRMQPRHVAAETRSSVRTHGEGGQRYVTRI